jgi:D-alanine-D-alanine ligase
LRSIAILYGGKSGEHEVSLVSALSIVRHLDKKEFDPILIGIAKNGAFFLQDGKVLEAALKPESKKLGLSTDPDARVFIAPSDGFYCRGKKLAVDLVFPVLHGSFGEDGTIQGLLDTANLPYAGAPVLGSALGMDKEKAKAVWMQAGLPVVPYACVRAFEFADKDARSRALADIESKWNYPLFVKPASTGSSVGAAKAKDRTELEKNIAAALEWDMKALVEPFVRAREIECSVTGNDLPKAYVPGEIVSRHEFYDYDAKYIDPNGAELLIPAKLSAGELERVRELAVKAYASLDCAGFSRVDFFLDLDSGQLLLNEINTIPGFTSISMFPKMCEAGGLEYSDLIKELARLALERFEARAAIRYE